LAQLTVGDADDFGDLAQPGVGVLVDTDDRVAVVGEESMNFDSRIWTDCR
jgi:hypothetical protein